MGDTHVLLQEAMEHVNSALVAYSNCEDPLMPGVLGQDLAVITCLVLARRRLRAALDLRPQDQHLGLPQPSQQYRGSA